MMLDKGVVVKDACGMDRYELYDDDATVDLKTIRARTLQARQIEDELREIVSRLRSRFVPWEAIALELGVTRQAAQQRYARACRQ